MGFEVPDVPDTGAQILEDIDMDDDFANSFNTGGNCEFNGDDETTTRNLLNDSPIQQLRNNDFLDGDDIVQ